MHPRTNSRGFSPGFSLVELMVVIAIMLLLAALALPRLLDAQRNAYQAGVVSFLRTLQSDQESYRLANGSYADNFTDLGLAARGPVAPGAPFEPEASPQLAAVFPRLASFQVYAAASDQQAPPQTPPPSQPTDQPYGSKAPKKAPEGAGGGPGRPAGGGAGGVGPRGGGVGRGGGGGKATSGKAPRGAASGGTPTAGGGATGGAAPGQSGAGAPAGGVPGGSSAPSLSPSTKTNIVLKHNYIFTLLRPTPTTWTCIAAPVRDRGDSKFFFMDQSGVMRAELGKPAGASSPQL